MPNAVKQRAKFSSGGTTIKPNTTPHKPNTTPQYVPQFKLVIGNHKPSLRNIGEAMKRRLHIIPFTVTIPEYKRDHRLTEKLLRERDGILAWAVAGCLEWQRHGLQPPCLCASGDRRIY